MRLSYDFLELTDELLEYYSVLEEQDGRKNI